MCLVDVLGKGDKNRTLPVPLWAEPYITRWQETAPQGRPAPVCSVEKAHAAKRNPWNPALVAGGMDENTLERVVARHGQSIGITQLRPHDLRRTLAQMMRRAGAPLEQIQHQLGHESITTTQLYLGSGIELEPGKAGVDLIPLRTRRGR
jgi:integrase